MNQTLTKGKSASAVIIMDDVVHDYDCRGALALRVWFMSSYASTVVVGSPFLGAVV